MKLECCEATPCNWYRSHDRTRPNSGETGRADRGSIYGDYFCFLLTNAGARLFGHVRTLEEDLATGDGHYDKCVLCGNRHKGGKLCKCDFCPDVYHYGCIRGVRPKPKESSWFCPNPGCQAQKAKQAAFRQAS